MRLLRANLYTKPYALLLPSSPPPLTNPCSWQIDGQTVRVVNNDGSGPFPTKPVYVYMSVWDAGYISNGQWAGTYTGHDQPYYT